MEEFLANEAHKEYESTADEHALYLQRLSFELAERERLCKLLEEKQGREKELAENIASKKKFLQSLGSLLKGVKKATQPMQERFGMHHTWQAKQGKLARLLPAPMYVLYSLFLAHKETEEGTCDIRIHGSGTAAEKLLLQRSDDKVAGNDDDVPEGNKVDSSERDAKRQKVSKEPGGDETSVHPLSLVVDLLGDSGTKTLSLRFEFLLHPAGGVVLASCQPSDLSFVLVNLLPDDTGRTLPHMNEAPWNPQAAAAAGAVVKASPYRWAQHLAGLDFLPAVPPSLLLDSSMSTQEVSSHLASMRQQYRVPKIVQLLKQRVQAQTNLRKTVKGLPSGFNSTVKALDFEMTNWTQVSESTSKGMAGEAEDGEVSIQDNAALESTDPGSMRPWEEYMAQTFKTVFKGRKVEVAVEV